eukprot:jgi/Tetstr1/441779/TSEL_029996.t1
MALLKALELSLFRYEERLGKQRDYDLKSKLMEEPVRSAETASHVETIEALKALATNRDFPTDMRSLISHRLLDTPVYAISYIRAGKSNGVFIGWGCWGWCALLNELVISLNGIY